MLFTESKFAALTLVHIKAGFLNPCNKIIDRQTVQILDNTVVIKNSQIPARDDNSHKKVKFLFAAVIASISKIFTDLCRGSAPVMSVRYIQIHVFLDDKINEKL